VGDLDTKFSTREFPEFFYKVDIFSFSKKEIFFQFLNSSIYFKIAFLQQNVFAFYAKSLLHSPVLPLNPPKLSGEEILMLLLDLGLICCFPPENFSADALVPDKQASMYCTNASTPIAYDVFSSVFCK